MSPLPLGPLRIAGAGALVAGATTAYAYAETKRFVLRAATIPVLPRGTAPLRVLHVSDLHLTPRQARKHDWLRSLARLEPDLVITTGDFLAHERAVPWVLSAYGALLDVPGVFVFGSNDYFAPTLRNPLRYLLPDNGRRYTNTGALPWRDLRRGLQGAGWVDLSNRRASLTIGGTTIAFAGVDDPHLGYDDLTSVAGRANPDAAVRIGVTHAPYLRVIDQMTTDGYDVIVAGHTHGGQVRLPGKGALVTNCDLEPGRARGLHRHPTDPHAERSWLHVSAGMGTSPYAQMRLFCRPEATLLTLTQRPVDTATADFIAA